MEGQGRKEEEVVEEEELRAERNVKDGCGGRSRKKK